MKHCFCVQSSLQHSMLNHGDFECCWCGLRACFSYAEVPVEGHGPGRRGMRRVHHHKEDVECPERKDGAA